MLTVSTPTTITISIVRVKEKNSKNKKTTQEYKIIMKIEYTIGFFENFLHTFIISKENQNTSHAL